MIIFFKIEQLQKFKITEGKNMAWIYLVLTGFLAIGWPVGLKMVQQVETRITGILIAIFLLGNFTLLAAPITATKTISKPSLPIERPERPIHRPVRPVVPVTVNPGVIYQENYYNTNVVNSCQSYMDQIAALNGEITELKTEVARLQAIEDARLQKTLKAKHQKEMDAFDNRKSSVKTTNSIEIKTK